MCVNVIHTNMVPFLKSDAAIHPCTSKMAAIARSLFRLPTNDNSHCGGKCRPSAYNQQINHPGTQYINTHYKL